MAQDQLVSMAGGCWVSWSPPGWEQGLRRLLCPRRCCSGAAARRAHLSHGLEQRLLHVDSSRRPGLPGRSFLGRTPLSALAFHRLPFSCLPTGRGHRGLSENTQAQGKLQRPLATPNFCFSQPPPPRTGLVHTVFARKSCRMGLQVMEGGCQGWRLQCPRPCSHPPPFLLQLLARVVLKEARGWCGPMARQRGYVASSPGQPLAPQCPSSVSVLLQRDVCHPLLSLLRLHAGTARPPAPGAAPGPTETFPPRAKAAPGGF